MNLTKKLTTIGICTLFLFMNFGLASFVNTDYYRHQGTPFLEIMSKIIKLVVLVLVIVGFVYIVIGVINLIKSAGIKDKLEEIELFE